MSNSNIKVIYSFRLKNLLEIMGFHFLLETDNPKKPEFKCWVYEATPAFMEAYDKLLSEKEG